MVGSSRTITLNTDDKVAVGCLGPGNYIKATGMQLAPATCTSTSKLLLVDGQELSYSQLGCLGQNKEILLENGTCANGPGTVIRMGWQAGPEFIPLYDTCHDKVAAANYFSTHIIHGKSAAADDTSNERPSFSQGGYYPGIDVNTAYSVTLRPNKLKSSLGLLVRRVWRPSTSLPEVKFFYREDTWRPMAISSTLEVKTQLIIS